MNREKATLLLEIMRNGENYLISDLSACLDISVAELKDLTRYLVDLGVPILEAHGNLQLVSKLPSLDKDYLQQALAPHRVFINTVVNSTNQYLLDHVQIMHKGDICLSDFQFAGRGRRGRDWVSIYGGQINLSLFWQLSSSISANGLSLVIGLAVIDALHALGYGKLSLKWPNDILYSGRKLGGILIETASSHSKEELSMVIGIGLNVFAPDSWKKEHLSWAALSEIENDLDKNQLVVMMVDYLQDYLHIFSQQGFTYFRTQWIRCDYYLGKKVKLISNHILAQGIERGVMDDGSLIIRTSQGAQTFQGGEISLFEI